MPSPAAIGPSPSGAAPAYLDLMKRVVANWIYGPEEARQAGRAFDGAARLIGREWPIPQAIHSMIGLERLNNLQHCVETALRDNVPGDLLEAGVWRGGAAIFMKAILHAHGDDRRTVWLADSFAGLPPPDAAKYPHDKGLNLNLQTELAVSDEQVRMNFERYGLMDNRVQLLKGWFKDTLPTAPIGALAVLRLDGDLYESTMDTLVPLYPKLSKGGFLIIDDYGAYDACRFAIHDYRKQHGIEDEIVTVDWTGAYWRKT